MFDSYTARQYKPLARSERDAENREKIDEQSESSTDRTSRRSESRVFNVWFWTWANIILLLFSTNLLALAISTADKKIVIANTDCVKQTSMASPVLDDLDLEVKRKQMDTTFVQIPSSWKFRKEPGPEVDDAWHSLLDTRPVPVTREKIIEIGKDPSQAVQIPESWGYGNDMYFGRVDVFHHIHCLDALRREAYFDHYYGENNPEGLNSTSEFHKEHLSHCIHLLLQNVLCQANTDVYTHIWMDNLEHPWPDFRINHQCKNFDAILAWQKENALDEKAFSELTKPEGYPSRNPNHRFKEVHGWFVDHEDDEDFVSGEAA